MKKIIDKKTIFGMIFGIIITAGVGVVASNILASEVRLPLVMRIVIGKQKMLKAL